MFLTRRKFKVETRPGRDTDLGDSGCEEDCSVPKLATIFPGCLVLTCSPPGLGGRPAGLGGFPGLEALGSSGRSGRGRPGGRGGFTI